MQVGSKFSQVDVPRQDHPVVTGGSTAEWVGCGLCDSVEADISMQSAAKRIQLATTCTHICDYFGSTFDSSYSGLQPEVSSFNRSRLYIQRRYVFTMNTFMQSLPVPALRTSGKPPGAC